MESVIGLVMTAEAPGRLSGGVLKRVGEIQRIEASGNPSADRWRLAGAVNGAALAAGCDELARPLAFSRKCGGSKTSDVFHCDLLSQAQNP